MDPTNHIIKRVGSPLPEGQSAPKPVPGLVPVLPIRKNKSEGNWQWSPETLRERMAQGRVRVGGNTKRGFVIYILKDGEYAKIQSGEFQKSGRASDGSIVVEDSNASSVLAVPGSQWRISSHDATQYGSRLLAEFIPGRRFPFPKSLYAVEDAVRFFVNDKPSAIVLDFFAGSGTTTHAIARLNREDGGKRQSISVTNNEVSAQEADALRQKGYCPGDPEWEALGIFEYVTRPRITAALTGSTPEGEPVRGEYKFTDEFPMADGFKENVEFFRIDFANPAEIERGNAFEGILPILWLIAGAIGEPESRRGSTPWYIASHSPFAILIRETKFNDFRDALGERSDVRSVFLVTDSDDNFWAMRHALGRRYRCIQLYKSYLENFRVNTVDRHTAGDKEPE